MQSAICLVLAFASLAGGSSETCSRGGKSSSTCGGEDETSLLQVERSQLKHRALQPVTVPEQTQQVILHRIAPAITCQFTVASVVDSVFYNGKDITGDVKGKLDDWLDVKEVAFSGQPNAYLVVAGHNHEGRGCFDGGFQMTCSNGASTDDHWQSIGSAIPMESGILSGKGGNWTYPCISTAKAFLKTDPTVRRIWGTSDAYAVFRSQIFRMEAVQAMPPPAHPAVVSCLFTVNDVVDAVYYDEKDITASVIGDRFNWPVTKQITVDVVPNAYLVVLGHNNEDKSCSTGGFMIYCTNGVTTSSGWEAYNTSAVTSPDDAHRLGEGGGWHLPCASGANVSLVDKPEMPKIFASDTQKFAAFRIRLVKEANATANHTLPKEKIKKVPKEVEANATANHTLPKEKIKKVPKEVEANATANHTLPKEKIGKVPKGVEANATAKHTLPKATDRKIPRQAEDLLYGKLVKPGISAGDSHTCQLSKDGLVGCWGRNQPDGRATPLLGVGAYTQISAGYATTCGIIQGGQAYCWGNNAEGQALPPDNGKGPFQSISVGRIHACGIRSTDNMAICWGSTEAPVGTPPAGAKYTQISVSPFHSCAIKASDGSAECWGLNTMSQASPPHLKVSHYKAIEAGGHHTCALRSSDSSAVCWGGNDHGQTTAPSGSFEAISVGGKTSCGLRSNGELQCWGANDEGQATPPSGKSFEAVSVGFAHACAVEKMGGNATGKAQCWGRNTYGQATPDWLWDH